MNILSPACSLASESLARNIFSRGTDYLGAQEVKRVLGVELVSVPSIPFTEEELRRARLLGQFLMLFVPKTMQDLYEQTSNKLTDGGKLLYEVGWYGQEVFYTTDPAVTEPTWKLMSREVIPGSLGKNYLDMTQAISDYLVDQVYADQTLPTLYQRAVEEFSDRKSELGQLMDSDWEKVARELVKLTLNQLFRPNPSELACAVTVYEGVNQERLLPGTYHWSAVRSSRGDLVFIGGADSNGVGVGGFVPRDSNGDLGVSFSRSGLAGIET